MKFKVPMGASKVAFSIRVDESDFVVIDNIQKQSGKSYNFIVNEMIKYAIANLDSEELKTIANDSK